MLFQGDEIMVIWLLITLYGCELMGCYFVLRICLVKSFLFEGWLRLLCYHWKASLSVLFNLLSQNDMQSQCYDVTLTCSLTSR